MTSIFNRMAFNRMALAVCLGILGASQANAAVALIAAGTLTGSSADSQTDLSCLNYALENGLPANMLGGIGSGRAWAGGDIFLAAFQTVTMNLAPYPPGAALPLALKPSLTGTTLLWSATPLTYGSGAGLGRTVNGGPLGSGAPAANTSGKFYFGQVLLHRTLGQFRPGADLRQSEQCPTRSGADPGRQWRHAGLRLRRIRSVHR